MTAKEKLVEEIIEVANELKEKGCDLSKIRFTKTKKTESKDWTDRWKEEFDNIRNDLKESGMNLNIPITQKTK